MAGALPATVKHLIVPLDVSATSLCHYENLARSTSAIEPIAADVLERVVKFAEECEVSVQFLYGNVRPSDGHASLISRIPHVKIVPLKLQEAYGDSVLVVNPDEIGSIDGLALDNSRNVVLRLAREQIGDLSRLVSALFGRFKRLNVCLLDIGRYDDGDIARYARQLESVAGALEDEYRAGRSPEISVVTDRLLLSSMHNCGAGIENLTVGLDGRIYLCPGFYYDSDVADACVGDLEDGVEIKNAHLLRLDRAPICSMCDAYHCRRCVYLNKVTTLEINTPSRQQCVLAHAERNISRKLLERLRDIPTFRDLPAIPELEHDDPFVLAVKKPGKLNAAIGAPEGEKTPPVGPPARMSANSPDSRKSLEELSVKELLLRIHRTQLEILRQLK
jgi:CXXX repeat peptide maturase